MLGEEAETDTNLEHEKKFKIKALGGLCKTHKSKMDKLSDAPLESMDAPTQREPKIGKVYIGTKVIRAEPMCNEAWIRSQNKWQEGQETAGDGYRVQYEDGYLSWSPKHVFERCYRELTPQEIGMTFDY